MAERKNRYKKALAVRIREEEAAENRQQQLRRKFGLSDGVSVVRESAGYTVLSLLRVLLKVLAAVLAFAFVIVLLDPEMRRMFFEMPLFDFMGRPL